MHKRLSARARRFLFQRLIGILLLVLCIVTVLPGSHEDASPVLFFAPLGAYLVFTKKLWLVF